MDQNDLRMSGPMLKVLRTILDAAGDELSGAHIGREANLKSGTLYPILMRFEANGWLISRWEVEVPQDLGRPRRRLYRLTGFGRCRAVAALYELAPASGRLSWA